MYEELEALLNESYLSKVQKANQAYNVLKRYFVDVVGEKKAQEYMDAFCLVKTRIWWLRLCSQAIRYYTKVVHSTLLLGR